MLKKIKTMIKKTTRNTIQIRIETEMGQWKYESIASQTS